MTYQGERTRQLPGEKGRFFEVSKVRIGADGHVSDVLWGEVDAGTDRDVGARVVATAAEVVDHLPERAFVIVEHEDGRECIAFDGAPSPGRNVADLASLDDQRSPEHVNVGGGAGQSQEGSAW